MRPDDLEGFGPVGSNGPNLLPRLHDAAIGREDTVIGRLLSEAAAEIETLRGVLGRILENEASDYKVAETFGGYVLDDELREEARAALEQEGGSDNDD